MTTTTSAPHPTHAEQRLMTPAEVAYVFRVDTKTVTRWASTGRLSSVRTLGGHRRFDAREVEALLARTRVERVPSARANQGI